MDRDIEEPGDLVGQVYDGLPEHAVAVPRDEPVDHRDLAPQRELAGHLDLVRDQVGDRRGLAQLVDVLLRRMADRDVPGHAGFGIVGERAAHPRRTEGEIEAPRLEGEGGSRTIVHRPDEHVLGAIGAQPAPCPLERLQLRDGVGGCFPDADDAGASGADSPDRFVMADARVRDGGRDVAGREPFEPGLLVSEEGADGFRDSGGVLLNVGPARLIVHDPDVRPPETGNTGLRAQRDGAPRPQPVASEGKAEVYVL